jgi:hypothetical protein
MIVLHYRAIPDLRRQVQQATASARAARQPPSTRRPCAAAPTPGGAGQAARSTRPQSVRRRAAACIQLMDSADPLRARGVPCAFAAYLVQRDGRWQRVERGIPGRRERICSVS